MSKWIKAKIEDGETAKVIFAMMVSGNNSKAEGMASFGSSHIGASKKQAERLQRYAVKIMEILEEAST